MDAKYIADLHIHSLFSYATSKDMHLDSISHWARLKGIDLLTTGDITHPMWRRMLRSKLKKSNRGGIWQYAGIDFILGTEVSNIFQRKGKTYKIHTLIYFSNFDVVEEACNYLNAFGKLDKDGRPTLKLDVEKMCYDFLKFGSDCFFIFAHIWTPWFSIFGNKSGFENLDEVFSLGYVPENVVGFETGLSSDPSMNWKVCWLDGVSLISSSDAHSPLFLGREATVFREKLDFFEMRNVLKHKRLDKILFTIEFFPQEGKYYYDGHRKCKVKLHPLQTKKLLGRCPVCGRSVTVGVLNRIMNVSRNYDEVDRDKSNKMAFKRTVGLLDIISHVRGYSKKSRKVLEEYSKYLTLASELDWLIFWDEDKILEYSPQLCEAIRNIRMGKVIVHEGFDGCYGKVLLT